MTKKLKGLLSQAADKTRRAEAEKISRTWEKRAWTALLAGVVLCLCAIFTMSNPLRMAAVAGILALCAGVLFLLVRSYNQKLVSLVCDQCDPSLALEIMEQTSRRWLFGLLTSRNLETWAAVLNCMMLEGREDQARQAMKELEISSRDWNYRKTVLLCMYHFMKKDSMEIGREYSDLSRYAASNYKDARQNYRWMEDMRRLTDLEDRYSYVKDPAEKAKYRQELTDLLEEKLLLSGNKAQRLQMMFRLAQIELKEEEYDLAAARLEEIAREGNTLGVAARSRQILAQILR